VKISLSVLLVMFAFKVYSQVDQGTNSFHIGGIAFNKETQNLNIHPAYTDTLTGITYQGNQNYDITLGYRCAIIKSLSIGIESRFLANKLSSYQIHSGGFSLRYHFPIGQLGGQKSDKDHLEFVKTGAIARNFFYLDYTALFGELKFENQTLPYQSNMLQLGVQFRLPVDEMKFLRHLGIEFSLGACYRTNRQNDYALFAVSQAKVHYFLDRHYTRNIKKREAN